MKTKKDIFEPYIKIARFIAKIYGPRCEVLVHDLEDLDHTIIFIENNHVTGRQVGGKITDFGLKMLLDEKWRDKDYVLNYDGISLIDNKKLRTSTFYIRDERERIVGLLIVNIDITGFDAIKSVVDFEVSTGDDLSGTFDHDVTEKFLRSYDEVMRDLFSNALADTGYDRLESLDHLKAEEKKKIMARLYKLNFFNLKGAVVEASNRLGLSAPTAYRYLREIQSW